MAARGWGGSLATAIAVAAGAGAAQLGLGYGLGIISWQPDANGQTATWVTSLAWTIFIAATSVVAGAYCADRLGPRATSTSDDTASRIGAVLWRMALSIAAAVGALITVALVAVPARAAVRLNDSSPQTTAGAYAVVGVILGLLLAIGALTGRAIAANVIASVSWLWLLAIVSVIDGVAAGRGIKAAQLGVWQFTAAGPLTHNVHVWDAVLTLGAALMIGSLAALPAARRGDNPIGVAISGAASPLLVAAAYFLAAPRLDGVGAEEMSPYLIAPYATITGLAGSVVVAACAPGITWLRLRRNRPRPAAAPPKQHGEPDSAGSAVTTASRSTDPMRPGLRESGVDETVRATAKVPVQPVEVAGSTSPAATATVAATSSGKGKRGRGR